MSTIGFRETKVYTIQSTSDFIDIMVNEHHYDVCQLLNTGVLGLGDMVLIPPTENQYYYVIREHYLNSWESGQSIRRCKKLSQAILKEMEEAEAERLKEEEENEW